MARGRAVGTAKPVGGMGLIVLGVAAAIAFGTLYPFQLQCPGSLAAAIAHFKPAWPLAAGRGDIVANLVLYVPLGLAIVAWLHRRPAVIRIGLAVAIGIGLSLALELAQACEPARVSSWTDLALNAIGVACGAVGGVAAGRHLRRAVPGAAPGDVGAVFLLLLFAGWRLAPYVPTIDWQKWKNALKPLFHASPPSGLETARHAVLWLVVGGLIQAAFVLRRPAPALLLLFAAYFGLKVMIVGAAIVPAELGGAAIGLLAALTIGRRLPALAAAVLLAGVIAYQGLQPWRLGAAASAFCWVPFCGFLSGSLMVNVISIAEKLFLYGGLVWLLVRAGFDHRIAGVTAAVPLLALELVQTHLPSRVAEITDPLLALAVAEILRQIDRRPVAAALAR